MPKPLPILALLLSLLSFGVHANDNATDKDTLFQILAAEFSIYRDQFNQAQHFYLAQARSQQNVDFAERATRLALHNQQYVDMLEAALIWFKADKQSTDALLFLSLAYAYNAQPNLALDYMLRLLPLKAATDFTRLVNVISPQTPAEQHYLQALTQASSSYPKNIDLHLALALLHSRTGNSSKAIHHMDKAVALDANHPQVLDYSVLLYVKHDQPEKALNTFRKAIKKDPENTQLRRMYVQLALRHQPEEARKELNYLLQQTPDDGYLLFNLALVNIELKNYSEARQQLQSLANQQTGNNTVLYYLGIIDYYDGKPEQALAAFSAIKEGAEYAQSQEHIVRIHTELEQYPEALQTIDKQLEVAAPLAQRERLYLLKARVLEKQGSQNDAYRLLTGLLEHDPDSVEIRYSRAMLLEANNQLSEMEADLRHILDLQPENTLALNALGYTLTNRTDRHQEALQLISKAHQLAPDDAAILDSMGWVYYRLGRNKEALTYLKKAYAAYPDGEIAAHLGEVLWVMGKQKEARKIFSEALKHEPNHETLNETLRRLHVSF